jgi:hypothetical protein
MISTTTRRLLLFSLLVSNSHNNCHGFSSRIQHQLHTFGTKSTFLYATPNDHVEKSDDHASDPSHETIPLTLYLVDKTEISSVLGANLDYIETDHDDGNDLKPLILATALQKLNISRALSFHSRSSRARTFVERAGPLLEENTLAFSVSGTMTASKRDKIIFKALESPKSVVANSQVLLSRDSVYDASWDLVYLADPFEDLNAVCQMLRRVGCAAPNKTRGYLLFPLVDEDLNNEMDRVYWLIWTVFKAMIVNDPVLRRDVYFLADEQKRLERVLTPKEFPESVHQAFLFPASTSIEMRNKMLGRLLTHAGQAHEWDRMFDLLLRYHGRHSHCHVHYSHMEGEAKLGIWLRTQRQRMKKGKLAPYLQRQLEAIGVIWDAQEAEWERLYAILQCYRYREWHCDVPQRHTVKGAKLGAWVERQRRKKGKGTLDPEKERRLDESGVVWKVHRSHNQTRNSQLKWEAKFRNSQLKWEAKFFLLQQYADREGHCSPLRDEEDGARLWFWLQTQRHQMKQGTLAFERQCRLEEIGVLWDASEARWGRMYTLLERFGRRAGHCNIQQLHVENGASLGTWLTLQRRQKKTGVLLFDRQRRLDEWGIDWAVRGDESKWEASFSLLQRYKDRNGHCNVPQLHTEDEAELGKWLQAQRRQMKAGKLDLDRQHRLGSMNVDWELFDPRWEINYSLLETLKTREGYCNLPQAHIEDGVKLGLWLTRQRQKKRKGTLCLEKQHRLEEIGVAWEILVRWEADVSLLERFKGREGHCNVPRVHTEDGMKLGSWLNTQRQHKKKGSLQLDRQRRLGEIGIVWETSEAETDSTWNEKLSLLQQYRDREGHCHVPTLYEEDGVKLGKWLSARRRQRKEGTLDIDKQHRLESIGVSWDAMEARRERDHFLQKRYESREEHGDGPPQLQKRDGDRLGKALSDQRRQKKKGTFHPEKQREIDPIDVSRQARRKSAWKWEANVSLLERYAGREGHCHVPPFHSESGFKLGRWLQIQRSQKEDGILDLDKQRRFENVGGIWDPDEAKWERHYVLLKRYGKQQGHCNVDHHHIENGDKLGTWLRTQRRHKKKGALAAEKQRRLDEIGVIWEVGPTVTESKWESKVSLLKIFKAREGHCKVTRDHREGGVQLGLWLGKQRQQVRNGTMDPRRQRSLELIGVFWEEQIAIWEKNFALLVNFKAREGHCNVPLSHVEVGLILRTWLDKERKAKREGTLDPEKERRLEELGVSWDMFETQWEESFSRFVTFTEREKCVSVPKDHVEDGIRLSVWMQSQRRAKKHGQIHPDRQQRLEELGAVL